MTASWSVVLVLAALALARGDPDLPGHSAPTETLDMLTLVIPMDRTYQGEGMNNNYAANGTAQPGAFNMRAYGLINQLLWSDVPVKWIIKNNKSYDEPDFCANTWERFPADHRAIGVAAAYRCFRAGPFAIPAAFTTIAENVIHRYINDPAYNYAISYTVLANGTKNVTITPTTAVTEKRVRVYRLAQSVSVNVRYTLYTRPYAAVLDSSKFFLVEARNLLAAGFIPGRHFTVMTKDEAYKFDGHTCVTFATEPHFLISQQDNPGKNASLPNSFVNAVRKFVASGGNFLAQCGGLSTYEQCDNVLPNGYNGRSCPPTANASICPAGYFLTTNGLYFPRTPPTVDATTFPTGYCPLETTKSVPRTPLRQSSLTWADGAPVKIAHPDLPINQFDGSWTYETGEVQWFSLWKNSFSGSAYGGVDSDWKPENFAHPLVEDASRDYTNYCSSKRSLDDDTYDDDYIDAHAEELERLVEEESHLRHEGKFNITFNMKRQSGCSTFNDDCLGCNAFQGASCRFCSNNDGTGTTCTSSSSCRSWQTRIKSASCPTPTSPPSPVPTPAPATPTCSSLPGVYFAAHGKIATSYGKTGGNVFYLAGHEYDNSNGRRLFLNAVLHPSDRSRNCTVMVPQCDPNGQNCVDIPKNFYIDPCAYGLPEAVRTNISNVSIPSSTLNLVSSLINSDVFDNPSGLLIDTAIVPTCPTRICITYLNSTSRHDSFGYFLWNATTKQIISQTNIFPDLVTDSECVHSGNTLCYGPFPVGAVVGWWVAVGSIYSPSPKYYYSLDPSGLPTSNFIKFGVDGSTFLAFSSTADQTDPYNELLLSLSFQTTGTCPPPTVVYINEPCAPFDPNAYDDLWYKSSCIAYVPLNVGKKNCGTPVEIPDGWILAPVDDNFNSVLSTYSNNWPGGCYQGSTRDGYGSFQNCTPTHTTYTTFINAAGQVCIRADCSDNLLLQYQTVDTRCHPDNYDQFCTRTDNSSVFDNNPLKPDSIFVNLIEDKSVTYDLNPGLPPRTVEIMFLLDVNNLLSARVAKTYWRDYALQAINTLPPNLNVGFGFAWSDGTLRGGQGIFYDRSLIQYWPDPSCNVAGTGYPCKSTNILSILGQLATSVNVGWQPDPLTPHHRIVVVMTASNFSSADLTPALAKALSDNNITPLFITLSGLYARYNSVKSVIPWAVLGSNAMASLPDVVPLATTPLWVPSFLGDINAVRAQITSFIDNDPWNIVTLPSVSSLSLTFKDRTFTSTPSSSPYPALAGVLPYSYKINLCDYPSYPNNVPEYLSYTEYWNYTSYNNNAVLGTCTCAETPAGFPLTVAEMRTRAISIMNLPPDHRGPTIRTFGRVSRPTYVTVARPPSYAEPEMSVSAVSGSLISIPVFANPSTLFSENEHNVYVQVQYVDNAQHLASLTMLDNTPTSFYGPAQYQSGPYDVCNMSASKGFMMQSKQKFCRLSDGSVPRGFPGDWGVATIFYRFCDGCMCGAGPVPRLGGAFVKVTFTCGLNLPPLGANLVFRLLPNQTIPVNLTANLTDPDDPTSTLFVKFTALQPTHGVLTASDGSPLDNVQWLISSQNVLFTQDATSIENIVYYTVQDPFGGLSPTYSLTFIPYKPPVWTVTPFSLSLPRLQTGNFTFTLYDVDSDSLTFDIAALQRQNIPLPSSMTFSGPGGEVNVLTLTPQTPIAVIPNPNPGALIKVTLFWIPDLALPDNATGTFITTLVDSEGLSANPLTLKVSVVPLNQSPNEPPFGTDPRNVLTLPEDSNISFSIVASDPDWYHQQFLTFIIVTLPSHGTLFTPNGTEITPHLLGVPLAIALPGPNSTSSPLTYVPLPNYFGNDTFDFVAIDPRDATSNPYPVHLTIVSVDDPPQSHNVTLTVRQNFCVIEPCDVVSVNFNTTQITASDPENDPICLALTSLPDPTLGTLLFWNSTSRGWVNVSTLGPNATFCNISWIFSFQPQRNKFGEVIPFASFTYTVVANSKSSPSYIGNVYVLHVNQPPTSANIDVYTDMNVPITLTLPHSDPDTTEALLTLVPVDIVFGTQGVFTYQGTNTTVEGGVPRLSSFIVTFTPDLNVYSSPDTRPVSILTFRIADDEGLTSAIFTARVFIAFVPLNITYRDNATIDMDEDTSVSFFVDRYGIDWFGGNDGFRTVTVTADKLIGNGTLSVCQAGTSICTPVIAGPVDIPPGSQLRFVPAPDEFGPSYFTFTLTLDPVTDAPSIHVPYVINVFPINDPPVLVPYFSLVKDIPNELDEDTYFIIRFDGKDIDSPLSSLKAKFITFLDHNVRNKLYICDGTSGPAYDDCTPGTRVVDGTTWVSPFGNASFTMLFIPDPNVNGETRLLLKVLDDYNAESSPVVADLTVLPINDPPSFDELDAQWVLNSNNKRQASINNTMLVISGKVSDVDFLYGKRVALTIVNHPHLGNFSSLTSDAPCVIGDDGASLVCLDLITVVNKWFGAGFDFVPESNATKLNFALSINDLGNVDKLLRINVTYANLTVNRTLVTDALIAKTPAAINNLALIAAPLAALLGGALIAALVFFFRNQAAANVQNYFARMALDMNGSAQSSPLYEGGAKGGQSPIYQSTQ